MWKVGARERFEAQWEDADGVAAALSPTIRFWRANTSTGAKEFLQSDATTFSATEYAFAMTNNSGLYSYVLLVPASAVDYNLTAELLPNDARFKTMSDTQYVSTRDIDDVYDVVAAEAVEITVIESRD